MKIIEHKSKQHNEGDEQWGIVFGLKSPKLIKENSNSNRIKTKKIAIKGSPTDFFMKIQDKYEHACLLESMKGPKKLAQFSFIGFSPKCIIKTKNKITTVENFNTHETIKIETNTPSPVKRCCSNTVSQDLGYRWISQPHAEAWGYQTKLLRS